MAPDEIDRIEAWLQAHSSHHGLLMGLGIVVAFVVMLFLWAYHATRHSIDLLRQLADLEQDKKKLQETVQRQRNAATVAAGGSSRYIYGPNRKTGKSEKPKSAGEAEEKPLKKSRYEWLRKPGV